MWDEVSSSTGRCARGPPTGMPRLPKEYPVSWTQQDDTVHFYKGSITERRSWIHLLSIFLLSPSPRVTACKKPHKCEKRKWPGLRMKHRANQDVSRQKNGLLWTLKGRVLKAKKSAKRRRQHLCYRQLWETPVTATSSWLCHSASFRFSLWLLRLVLSNYELIANIHVFIHLLSLSSVC